MAMAIVDELSNKLLCRINCSERRLLKIHQRNDGHNLQPRRFLVTLRQPRHRTTRGCAQHVRHACKSDKTRLHRQHYLEYTNKLRCGIQLAWAVGLPRMGALWCASCPFRVESGIMPNVIRHTEQRGKGRLQNGQAVASISEMLSGADVFEE